MPSKTRRRCAEVSAFLWLLTSSAATAWAAVGTLAESSGEIAAWGSNSAGQLNVPAGTYTAIAAGSSHSLGLRSDGTLVGWGSNNSGEINVPAGVFTDVAADSFHSLGIRSDGTLAGWGLNSFGQTNVPAGAFTGIAGDGLYSLGIRSSGTLAGWGFNGSGQTNVPAGAFTAIAAGDIHSLGLRPDGSVAGWGSNDIGQTAVPAGAYTAVAAGADFSLGIRSDGALAGWGGNSNGQINVPAGTFTAVAAGAFFGLGIRSDGALAGWGGNSNGQVNVPAGAFVAIEGGGFHSLALRGRIAYDGDLLVSYSGPQFGPNGLKANLNRSITVAGNATIESAMYLYNIPTMSVGGRVLLESGGQVNGAGTIDGRFIGQPGSSIVATGPLTLGKADHLQGFSTAGDLDAGAHAVTLQSRGFTSLGGATSVGGGTIGAANGVLLAPGAAFQGHGTIDGKVAVGVGATLNATGNLALGAAAVDGFFSDGTLNVLGHSVTIHDSHQAVLGPLTSLGSTHLEQIGILLLPAADYGTLTAAGGSLLPEGRNVTGWGTINGDFKNQGFVLALPPQAVLNLRSHQLTFTGAVSGRGAFAGDVLFEGSYSPGDSPAQVQLGSMTLGGDATLAIELGGLQPGSQHDKLLASAAHLSGTLLVELINGFVPAAGDTFDVISASAGVTGTFTQIVQPVGLPPGLNLEVLYSSTLVQLVVAPAFSADFDGDGDVDGDDLLQWQGDFGVNDLSDADNDGDSDGADFLAWQQQLGSGSGAASASPPGVPEPHCIVLVFLALIGRRALDRSPLAVT